MNYCSIEDAWGPNFNKMSETDTESISSVSANSTGSKDEYRKFLNLKEKFDDTSNKGMCLKVFTHINKCESCRNKLSRMYNEENSINGICKGFMAKLKGNSDALTMVLIIILILLIFKVFMN